MLTSNKTMKNLFDENPIPQIGPQQLRSLLEQPVTPLLIDVREPEEYSQGHIQGARLIPLGELVQNISRLPTDREIVCICHSGSRSAAAAGRLSQAGLQVSNLTGGMMTWALYGFPMVNGADPNRGADRFSPSRPG
jgi:rhodanese-related sulfurtransferase